MLGIILEIKAAIPSRNPQSLDLHFNNINIHTQVNMSDLKGSEEPKVFSDPPSESVGSEELPTMQQLSSRHVMAEDAAGEFEEIKLLRQGLHQRHIQMIALAGAIGTGLFLSSGQAIARAGPLGAFLGYVSMGLVAGAVTLDIGEMGSLVPLNGGIVRYAEYFVDPALAFADGWNIVYSDLVSIPAEIVAAAVLVQYWSDLNSAVWITIFGLLMLGSSLLFVRIYGELEFAFSMMKILLIVGVNLMVSGHPPWVFKPTPLSIESHSGVLTSYLQKGSRNYMWWWPRPYHNRLSILA